MSLSDRMAIFVDGRIVQIGTPEEVFGKPASTAVAGFLGSPPMNLLPARLRGAMLEIEGNRLVLPCPGGEGDQAVVAGIRPGDITIGEVGLPAMVELAEPQGESVIVDLRFGGAALKARIFSGAQFREGQKVQIGIDSSARASVQRGWSEIGPNGGAPGRVRDEPLTQDLRVSLSIEVDNLDEAHRRAVAGGFVIAYGPVTEPWGVRRFYVRDPFGRLVNILAHTT